MENAIAAYLIKRLSAIHVDGRVPQGASCGLLTDAKPVASVLRLTQHKWRRAINNKRRLE